MLVHDLGSFTKAEGEKIRRLLYGKTFMMFKVAVCPAGGEWRVSVSTEYHTTMEDFVGMLTYALAVIALDVEE